MNIRYTVPERFYHVSSPIELGNMASSLATLATGHDLESRLLSECDVPRGSKSFVSMRDVARTISKSYSQSDVSRNDASEFATWLSLLGAGSACDDMSLMQYVSVGDFVDALASSPCLDVDVPVCELLFLAARISLHLTSGVSEVISDAAVSAALCAYYCSFDADFQEIFMPGLQCTSASASVSAYVNLSSYLELLVNCLPSHGTITMRALWKHMSSLNGIETPLSDIGMPPAIEEALCDDGIPTGKAFEGNWNKLLGRHEHRFTLSDGTSFELPMSCPEATQYQCYEKTLDGLHVSNDVALAVMTNINPASPGAMSTIDFSKALAMSISSCVDDISVKDGMFSIDAKLGDVKRHILQRIATDHDDFGSIVITKSMDMQSTMASIVAVRDGDSFRIHDNERGPLSSVMLARCVMNTMDSYGEHTSDIIPAEIYKVLNNGIDPYWNKFKDEEKLGFGTYQTNLVHEIVVLGLAFVLADNDGNDGTKSFRIDSAACYEALKSMPCAFSEAMFPDDAPMLENRFSNDVDISPRNESIDDADAELSASLDGCDVTISSIASPTIFVICYIFWVASGNSPDDFVADVSVSKLTRTVMSELRKDDSFLAEHNTIPSMMDKMLDFRGHSMGRNGELASLNANGMTTDEIAAFVGLLGIMELYASSSSIGGYREARKEWGYALPLTYANMSSIDPYATQNDDMDQTERTEHDDGSNDRLFSGRTNPFSMSSPCDEQAARGDANMPSSQRQPVKTTDHWSPDCYESTKSIRRCATDITDEAAAGRLDEERFCGHESEIYRVEQVLSGMRVSSPLLIGAIGSGKSALVREIAKRIVRGRANPRLANSRLYVADSRIANVDVGDVIKELSSSNSILAFENIEDIYGMSGNGAALFRHALQRQHVSVIAMTTESTLSVISNRDPLMLSNFVPVCMKTLSDADIAKAIDLNAGCYEEYHHVSAPSDVRREIAVACSDNAINIPSPSRELQVLDLACATASSEHEAKVNTSDVYSALRTVTSNESISSMSDAYDVACKIADDRSDDACLVGSMAKPVIGDMSNDANRRQSLDLSAFDCMVGQEKQKEAIVGRLLSSQMGFYDSSAPRNVIMLVGPSGVGKTLAAECSARFLGMARDDVLKLAMAEFTERYSGSRLIGSAPGYIGSDKGGVLTNFAKAHNSGMVIFDEIEKANDDIIKMLLGLFDTGFIDSAQGEHVDCTGLTIFCTSNAAFESHSAPMGFSVQHSPSYQDRVDSVKTSLISRFGAPFVGRLSEVIVFDSLGKDDVIKAMRKNYDRVIDEYHNRLGINVAEIISQDTFDDIVDARMADVNLNEIGIRGIWKNVEGDIKKTLVKSIVESKRK